jgi:hypothetical protein
MVPTLVQAVRRSLPVAILVSAFASPVDAQFWEKKDWRQWSKSECQKMLTDSPWARKFENLIVVQDARGMRSRIAGAEGQPERESTPTLTYFAQLRSALPIRQAVVRSMMIQVKYDKMSEAEKKSFDQQAEAYINQSFADRVVVHIVYDANVTTYRKQVDDMWRSGRPNLLTDVYLVPPRGERLEVARFIPPEGGTPEFELIFPKGVNGEPVVTENDKEFSVEIPPTSITVNAPVSFNEKRILFEFDVRKMKYRGTFEY